MKARIEEIQGTLEVYQTEEQFVLTGTIPTGSEKNVESTVWWRIKPLLGKD